MPSSKKKPSSPRNGSPRKWTKPAIENLGTITEITKGRTKAGTDKYRLNVYST